MDKEDVVQSKMKYYSALKEQNIMPFAATWMDGETVRLSKIRQKKTIMMISLICGILKNGTNEFIYKTEIESQM